MTLHSEKKGLYHGWWIVVTSLLLMAIVFAALISLPGVFTIFVTEEFGISRTTFTTHMTISTLTSILASFFVGSFFKKYDPKKVMAVCIVIVALCFAGYSFATNVYYFYAISAVIGFVGLFLTNVPISILINNWFGPRMKGKAMGIAMVGSGIGAMVLNPILTSINQNYGWRMSYRLLALLSILLLPVILATIVKSPEVKGIQRLGDDLHAVQQHSEDEGMGLTLAQALRSGMFWVLFVTFFLFSATTTIFNANALPYMTDVGLDPVRASTWMSLSSFGVILGKLGLGVISDKRTAKVATTVAIACLILGLVFLLGVAKVAMLAPIATLLFGLGNANATVTMPLITNDLMGKRDFSVIFSYVHIAASLGSSFGPLMGAAVYDSTGSYAAAWSADILLMVIMLVGVYLCYHMKPKLYQKLSIR